MKLKKDLGMFKFFRSKFFHNIFLILPFYVLYFTGSEGCISISRREREVFLIENRLPLIFLYLLRLSRLLLKARASAPGFLKEKGACARNLFFRDGRLKELRECHAHGIL